MNYGMADPQLHTWTINNLTVLKKHEEVTPQDGIEIKSIYQTIDFLGTE